MNPELQAAVERDITALFEGVTLNGINPPYGTAEDMPIDDVSTYYGALEWEQRHICRHDNMEVNAALLTDGIWSCDRCKRVAQLIEGEPHWTGPHDR